MTTVLIIVCAVFCVGIVVAIVGHLGKGVSDDVSRRRRVDRRFRRSGDAPSDSC
jgi:hypothetical protein